MLPRARWLVACGALLTATMSVIALVQPQRAQGQQQGFTFALLGDLGYFREHEPWVENVLADINRDDSLSFVVHVGDLSRPIFACTDELVSRRLAQFNASMHPLIYTPGDNEWTDCHDKQGIEGGDPLARLAKLREMFFEGDRSLGKRTMPVVRQSSDPAFAKYRENVRWDMGGVTFLTLHVVGSNNNLGRTTEADSEHAERTQANLVWLQQGFAHAKSTNSRAVMILQQANMFPNPPGPNPKGPSGFADVRASVEKETLAFGKPVVLVHGDTHFFRIDNPFSVRPPRGQPGVPGLENFTRLELFGTPNHHWVKVAVDPVDRSVFTYRTQIVAANVIKR
jgi:hypothetical protein